MNYEKIFLLNALKIMIILFTLIISLFLMRPLFMLYKLGAGVPTPYFAYLFGIVFIITTIYFVVCIVYTLIQKFKK